ncbi:hypothetical protein GOODEAATRI_034246 [Goodea atripinnis]|uniref:Uncharacterized protein n=1 Tax=Goodea atripinnis TaxID=208336 RepID=A0ABV0N9Q1_9TELE
MWHCHPRDDARCFIRLELLDTDVDNFFVPGHNLQITCKFIPVTSVNAKCSLYFQLFKCCQNLQDSPLLSCFSLTDGLLCLCGDAFSANRRDRMPLFVPATRLPPSHLQLFF